MTTRVALNGAAGRMGRTVIETAAGRSDVTVVAGFDVGDADSIDGVEVFDPDDWESAVAGTDPDVLVDFSVPASTLSVVQDCIASDVGLVVGTTGFEPEELDQLRAASDRIPLLKATNFSRGIQVLLRTVREAVPALSGYDLELLETHHNGKRDAPSGTARTILDAVQDHRDVEPVYGREGIAPREADEIGVFARRAGDVRGEHELVLAGNDEVVSLSHRAEDRAVFAAGALDAAAWLDGRDPEWYSFGAVIDDT